MEQLAQSLILGLPSSEGCMRRWLRGRPLVFGVMKIVNVAHGAHAHRRRDDQIRFVWGRHRNRSRSS